MDRLIAPNSVAFASRDLAPGSGTPQYATDGDPGVTPATYWPAYQYNAIQDEIMNLIAQAAITADKTVWDQLAQAALLTGTYLDAGSANSIAINPPIAIHSATIKARTTITFIAAATNTSPTVNVNVSGNGNVRLKTPDGVDPLIGDIVSGRPYVIVHNGTNWICVAGIKPSGDRRALTAAITVYVATTGSDSNPGTSALPFLTIQKGVNTLINSYDFNGYVGTVSIAAGSYAAGASINTPIPGGGLLRFVTTGGTVTIGGGSASNCFRGQGGATFELAGDFTLSAPGTTGVCIIAGSGTLITITGGAITFGPTTAAHLLAQFGGTISYADGINYTISGGALAHMVAQQNGSIINSSKAITTSGTPNFSGNGFAAADHLGTIIAAANSFPGTGATGTRYTGTTNSVIDTQSGGANYFPGNGAGAVGTGAQYV